MGLDPFATDVRRLTREAQESWNQIAPWWDARVGEDGNLAVRPAVERLLGLRDGERVLEIACGNGAFARRMAEVATQVVACDFSVEFLRLARERTAKRSDLVGRIDYRLLDATDDAQLAMLGSGPAFDAAVCIMGLMDMAAIDPLMAALARLLRPGGRFVFALTHPCFNTTGAVKVVEEQERDGDLVEVYAVKVWRYLQPLVARGIGIVGQPTTHLYFERPLSVLFSSCFQAGFALDGFEEIAATSPGETDRPRLFSWARFPEIPPFMVARVRRLSK